MLRIYYDYISEKICLDTDVDGDGKIIEMTEDEARDLFHEISSALIEKDHFRRNLEDDPWEELPPSFLMNF